jgi:hypothetical protein
MPAHPGGDGAPPETAAPVDGTPPTSVPPETADPVDDTPPTSVPLGTDAPTDGAPPASVPPAAAAPQERPAAKTTRQRAEEKRQAKLDLVQEQVESGSLVIRGMTEEERERYPPQPTPPQRLRRR